MFTCHRVVVASTVPLLAYRVCEELYQHADVEVLGPVATAEDALTLARCCASPIVLCDGQLAQTLAPHMPAIGGRLICLRLDAQQAPAGNRLGLSEIDVRTPTWPAHLRACLAEEPAALPEVAPRERRQRSGAALSGLLDAGRAVNAVSQDPETDLPTSAAFNAAVGGLPRLGAPTAILFIDLTPVIAGAGKEYAWLAEAGMRLRRMLRQGDLVFRLDRALYAVLAPCPAPDRVPALRERLRWMLCGSDFIAPERIVIGDAYWTAGASPNQAAAAAWQSLTLQRARPRP